jgi:uroporphyrinogen III methyltransferase/synthase
LKKGKVYLVGTGPGDIGLITQKAINCLIDAEVIVYDRLVDERILKLASPQAERIYVGKSAGHHSREQDDINELLIEKANSGNNVVRLKGGDPFVFGRGGEEAIALADSQIPFEVIPGISSAIAVPAYSGIPVTHRGVSSSFAVVTGHESDTGTVSSINWEKMVTGVDTLILLMGLKNLPSIVSRIIEHGRSPDTPVAVISDGTKLEQITVVGCLKDIVKRVREKKVRPPAVVVVGQVVNLRRKLRWFDKRPLFGKRILVTRAYHQADTLCNLFIEKGAIPILVPSIHIRPIIKNQELDNAISNLDKYHWIIFTSVNGVNAFFKHLNKNNMDTRTLAKLKIGAIGPATAEALKANGVIPDYVPSVYTSRGILDGLGDYKIEGQRFLLPRADIADKELLSGIRKYGAEVDAITIYNTVYSANLSFNIKKVFSLDRIDVITFTSASTVSGIITMLRGKKQMLHDIRIACIGPKTADAVIRAGFNADIIAKKHTIRGLVAEIEEYFSKDI